MPTLPNLIAFVTLSLVIIVIPGPSVLVTIARALSGGVRVALLTVLGNAIGVSVQFLAIAFGLGAVLAKVEGALLVLRIIGGVYLLWLGIQAWRHAGDKLAQVSTEPMAARESTWQSLQTGFVLGVSNPKTLVFFSALLPQFIVADRSPVTQILVLGLVFAAIALPSDSVWAVVAARARNWFAHSSERLRTMNRAGGVILFGLGLYTLFGHVPGVKGKA